MGDLKKYEDRMQTNEQRSKSAQLQTHLKAHTHCEKALNKFLQLRTEKEMKDYEHQQAGLMKLHSEYIRNVYIYIYIYYIYIYI